PSLPRRLGKTALLPSLTAVCRRRKEGVPRGNPRFPRAKRACARRFLARYLPPRRSDGVGSSSRDGGGGTCEETPVFGAAHGGGRGPRASRVRLREQEEQQQQHNVGVERRQRDCPPGLVVPVHLL